MRVSLTKKRISEVMRNAHEPRLARNLGIESGAEDPRTAEKYVIEVAHAEGWKELTIMKKVIVYPPSLSPDELLLALPTIS